MNRFNATSLFSLLSILMITAVSAIGDKQARTLPFIMTLGIFFLSRWFFRQDRPEACCEKEPV